VTAEGRGDVLRSPMTGVVIEVVTEAGATVTAGQVLVIVESMKMNNELRSPRDGIVDAVHVQQGERVERNATLVTIR
jgi:biotin carboxyl carrier protein